MVKKRIKKFFVVLLLILAMVLGCAGTVVAASKKTTKKTTKKVTTTFKDVTKKTQYYKDIEYLYSKGAYSGIVKKGSKFKPTTKITQKEFIKTLKNLYGSRISLKAPKKVASTMLTQKYATDTLRTVSKQLGKDVWWTGGTPKGKVTRAKAAFYTHTMIKNGSGILDP